MVKGVTKESGASGFKSFSKLLLNGWKEAHLTTTNKMECKIGSNLTALRYSFVSATTFCLSAKEAKVYVLEILECTDEI